MKRKEETITAASTEEETLAQEHLTTGDLARESGTTVRTVRFYEEVGLLTPVGRTEGKHRMYSRSELEKLRFIGDLRMVDCSIAEIRMLLLLREQKNPTREQAEEAKRLVEQRLEAIREKLLQIRRVRDDLSATLEFLSECTGCGKNASKNSCRGCDAMQRSDLPNTIKWIW